ncbi:cell division protein FtsQ/DivIB [Marinicella gelatinilytica]|uniref:cell division protein FtsQ/DivIB n=1 Tax=Marinicella gelatinilytica TaxID=2996017 RepID=UPI0022609F58|nr:cell division protein FtsQ/DivIB [Marinicella gelatinilytica]MCX7545159.1 cell division protein FtsQ/DivIB [Marinicella gelatinilytica]
MSKIAQLILIFSLLTLLLVSALMSGLIHSERWEIKQVEVAAEYQRVTAEQVRLVVKKTGERSFFRLDTDQVKNALKSLNWVREAHVVKQWPDSLKVTLVEHQPKAIWNDRQLINQRGELFDVERIDDVAGLPKLYAPDNQADQIYKMFIRFNRLLQPVGHEIATAQVSQRGGWQLELRNGLQINLGNEQQEARALRLADTWQSMVRTSQQSPQRIDLRYSNGYVVQWHPGNNEQQPSPAQLQDQEVSS